MWGEHFGDLCLKQHHESLDEQQQSCPAPKEGIKGWGGIQRRINLRGTTKNLLKE